MMDIRNITSYIDRFAKVVTVSDEYDMSSEELLTLSQKADSGDSIDAVSTTFTYGYTKGYCAALDAAKEGGAGV